MKLQQKLLKLVLTLHKPWAWHQEYANAASARVPDVPESFYLHLHFCISLMSFNEFGYLVSLEYELPDVFLQEIYK